MKNKYKETQVEKLENAANKMVYVSIVHLCFYGPTDKNIYVEAPGLRKCLSVVEYSWL